MLKTLVSLNTDLASSIALRYACQMAGITAMELRTIHVEEPGAERRPPGSGWVERSWEKELLKTKEEELAQLIQAERSTCCPPLTSTKTCMGDREEEILRELREGPYDLFVEGTLYPFSAVSFQKRIRSRLYRNSPCPVLLVKNLVGLDRIALLLGGDVDSSKVATTFLRIFKDIQADTDLFYYGFGQGGPSGREGEDPEEVLSAERKRLESEGKVVSASAVIRDAPDKASVLFKTHGLTVSSVHHVSTKKSPLIDLLHRVPSPILFCTP